VPVKIVFQVRKAGRKNSISFLYNCLKPGSLILEDARPVFKEKSHADMTFFLINSIIRDMIDYVVFFFF